MHEKYGDDNQEPSTADKELFVLAMINAVSPGRESKDPNLSVFFDSEGFLETTVREEYTDEAGQTFVTYTHYGISPNMELTRGTDTVTKAQDDYIQLKNKYGPDASDYDLKLASIMAQYGCSHAEAVDRLSLEILQRPAPKRYIKGLLDFLDALALEEESGYTKVTAYELAEITARINASFTN